MAEPARLHTILATRLKEHAGTMGWRVTEEPYGDGTLLTIHDKEGQGRVAAYPGGQMLVLSAPARLRADLLLWQSTLTAFEGNPRARFERRG